MYTEKQHAVNLIAFLENFKSTGCPIEHIYKYWFEFKGMEDQRFDKDFCDTYCSMCSSFINLEFNIYDKCPCDVKNCKYSVKRSWLALEEKGYI